MTASTHHDGPLNRELRALLTNAGLPEEFHQTVARANTQIERSGQAAGLAVGETAPDFTLPNSNDAPVHLAQRLAAGPVVVSFYRGAWCPFCNLELRALQSALPRIQQLGASLIAISRQAPDPTADLIEKHQLTFDVLSDLDGTVTQDWRVSFALPPELIELYLSSGINLVEENADGSSILPVPATFVLDAAGIVRARYISVDYTTRMEPEDIIAALAGLVESGHIADPNPRKGPTP